MGNALAAWLKAYYPGRGGPTKLVRLSGAHADTVRRALRGDPIITEPAAQRISDATGGVVTVEQLMGDGVRAKPRRKAATKRRRGSRPAQRRKGARIVRKAAA